MATREEITQFFCRHLVALNVAWKLPDGTTGATAFSSFVLEVRGIWFLVTAGHIIKKLYDSLPKCERVEASLFDGWQNAAHREPIPFNLRDTEHIEFEAGGIDVGLLLVHPIHRRLLEVNGIQAFDEKAWRDPPADLANFVVVGLPDQFINQIVTKGSGMGVAVSPTMVAATRTTPPPGREKAFPHFYGQLADTISDPQTNETLEGMLGFSGGPILGFQLDQKGEATRYYLVAAQAAWWRDIRVVNGPLMAVVANELERHLDEQGGA